MILPSGITSSGWPAVEAKCVEFGDEFDEWQRGLGRVILAKRANGEYAATVGGITISIPRQVAKTFLVGRIVFALCVLFPDLRVIWTAHRARTATQTFGKLRALAARPAVLPYMLGGSIEDAIRSGGGEQEIRFANGSIIMFGAREQGLGRGFDEVDIEVFDEAQILTEKALEDMVAAANQSRHLAGALLFYMGTPPRPVDPGEVFKTRRREALEVAKQRAAGEDVEYDGVYIETSADPNADPDDQEQWRKANPSFPDRTPLRSMLRLRKNLVTLAGWLREGLGIWDSDQEGSRAISVDLWSSRGVDVAPDGLKSFGVAFSMDGSRLAIAGAVAHGDEKVHVELIDVGTEHGGLAPLADWLCEKDSAGVPRWRRAGGGIVLGGAAGAAVLKQLLVERRVNERWIRIVNTPQYLQACAMLAEAVDGGKMSHLTSPGQQVLDDSIAIVDKDKRGGWKATTADGDETPAEAVSLALWGARTTKRKPRDESKPRGVIL